ncbi:hypothetical protein JCM24511_08052 [Saitozyma sp. JCM 24511]|nr:hypothetical protein JCM24511_08052 [Saitozyma sp. JCM 24511]
MRASSRTSLKPESERLATERAEPQRRILELTQTEEATKTTQEDRLREETQLHLAWVQELQTARDALDDEITKLPSLPNVRSQLLPPVRKCLRRYDKFRVGPPIRVGKTPMLPNYL